MVTPPVATLPGEDGRHRQWRDVAAVVEDMRQRLAEAASQPGGMLLTDIFRSRGWLHRQHGRHHDTDGVAATPRRPSFVSSTLIPVGR